MCAERLSRHGMLHDHIESLAGIRAHIDSYTAKQRLCMQMTQTSFLKQARSK